MKLTATLYSTKRPKADLLVLPCFQGEKGPTAASSLDDLQDEVAALLKLGDFKAKEGETSLTYLSGTSEERLLLVGLGKKPDCEALRKGAAAALKVSMARSLSAINFLLPTFSHLDPKEVTRGVAEGLLLANYLYDEWKSEKTLSPIKSALLIGSEDLELLRETEGIVEGVNLARKLVNRNADDVTPQTLGKVATQMAERFPSLKATVLNKEKLQEEKLNLLLAVGSGSAVDPALVILEYQGAPESSDLTMVVGKGVTFDSGGLNLKPTHFIEDMRADMGGAATALGVIQAAAAIKLKANIVAIIPTTENAIDAKSYKPGDVYRSHAGVTVEITNTDAEGRLILADALSYGQKIFQPSRIIDLATLTGAIIIALGDLRAGLFSNHDQLAKLCIEAGEKTGEKVWRMPLDPDYKKLLKSEIADIKNAGEKRMAGSVTAAIFLQEFIQENTPWIHLDIAGTAFLDKARDYHLSQATGSGVRLLIELIGCLR